MSFKPTNPKSQFINKEIKKFALAIMKHQGEPHFRNLKDGSADFDIDTHEFYVRELKDILMANPFVNGKPKYELSNYLEKKGYKFVKKIIGEYYFQNF